MSDLFTLGDTLKMAREARKLTQSDVAEATRIKVHIIDAIERNDFERLDVPLYGKGFVKIYAECLGLDPEPLIRQYMARYARSVRPSLKAEHSAPAIPPEPVPAMPSAKLAKPRRRVDWRGLFDDFAHAARERVERMAVRVARMRAASRARAGMRGSRVRRVTESGLVRGSWVRPTAVAAGVLLLAVLLVAGVARLARRDRTAAPAAERPAAKAPAAPALESRTPAPLRLAEEPPAPYLKMRQP